MKKYFLYTLVFFSMLTIHQTTLAQTIKVNPTGVNVNAHAPTTVFLTFGNLQGYRPVEACWSSELIAAAPDLGFKPNPATVYGCLPVRYNQSTLSANDSYTDIMTIPTSVSHRAYQNAAAGNDSVFFYVRRFVSLTAGRPDQYVVVTCRMTGGGARSPFALTDVKLVFDSDKPIAFLKSGEKAPKIQAQIAYNGTGRLKGRWEVVKPGEEIPDNRDLLTEATLPVEERGKQRRYTQLATFNVFLPPVGKYILPGPDASHLPNLAEGQYLVLLRIEAVDDKEADSNLAAVGAGTGIVHSGAVAGFPLPYLRYFIGGGEAVVTKGALSLLLPGEGAIKNSNEALEFIWAEATGAAFYRLEMVDAQEQTIHSALLPAGINSYRAPSWLKEKSLDGKLRWRVLAFNQSAEQMSETNWRSLRFAK
ncbi:MAG: hypothetical protein AB1757_01575 [Acidobacteriota bacterium]